MKKPLCAVLLLMLLGQVAGQETRSPVRVDGTRIVDASGAPLLLRGTNWGWWGCVEPEDAAQIRALGGTLVRVAFMHDKITDPPDSDQVGGEGLALLDKLCQWLQDAGLWFILDYHTPPGGCNPWSWNYGGANRFWREREFQQQWLTVWTSLVQRYRHHDRLLAYELMNEPLPPSDYPSEDYRRLCLEAIDAIRAEDPDRPIVVSDRCASSYELEEVLLPRPGLIYTFHFYSPGTLAYWQVPDGRYPGVWPVVRRWLVNSPEDWGASGDTDWHLLEVSFTPPEEATHGEVLLRSTRNAGMAWFDDVELLCDGEVVAFTDNTDFGPDKQSRGWVVERHTAGEFDWDPEEGHNAPGALRIRGTDSYNSFTVTDPLFPAKPGGKYTLRCWVKTRDATGHTYPVVAWFHHRDDYIDAQWLERAILPVVELRERHQVPVYCGEFGCAQPPWGDGARWVADVAAVLNRYGIPWTHWNWRETLGIGSMAVWVHDAERKYVAQQPLLDALTHAWRE